MTQDIITHYVQFTAPLDVSYCKLIFTYSFCRRYHFHLQLLAREKLIQEG